MGSGATKLPDVKQDVECEGVRENVEIDDSIIWIPKQLNIAQNTVVSLKKISLDDKINSLEFRIHGAGVLRIGIINNDPSGKIDCTKEAVYEIETGLGSGSSERFLFVDNGGYLCFGEDRENLKEYKYVKSTEFYIYVLCVYGEPFLSAYQNGMKVKWVQVTDVSAGLSLEKDGTEVQYGVTRRKSNIAWRKVIKTSKTYNLEWKMELEKQKVSEKIPKFGFLRIGLTIHKPNVHEFIFKNYGSGFKDMWCTESAVMAYPYSNTIAFRIDKLHKTIKHNLLVESVGHVTIENIDIDCEKDMYLVVELCSGDINLIDGPIDVKQPLGSTFSVENFHMDVDDDHNDVIDRLTIATGHEPCRLQFGTSNTKFVVEFRKVIEQGVLQRLKGNVKNVDEVKEVQITEEKGDALSDFDIKEEFTRNYELKEVRLHEEHVWVVEFKHAIDARRVWMENEWVIENTKVTLLPYYQHLGISMTKGKKPIQITETESILGLDKEKLQLIKASDSAKEQFAKNLQEYGLNVLWDERSSPDEIVVQYTGCDISWQQMASSQVKALVTNFSISIESIEVDPTNETGEKAFQRDLFDKIEYLEKKKVLASIIKKFPSSRYVMNKIKQEVKLKGPRKEIHDAYNTIHTKALEVFVVEIKLSKPLAAILRIDTEKECLLGSLNGIKREDCEIVGDKCKIYALISNRHSDATEVEKLTQIVNDNIKSLFVDQHREDVSTEASAILETSVWETFRIELMNDKCVHIETESGKNSSCVEITTTRKMFESVQRKVNDFLVANINGQDLIFIGKDVVLLLSEYRSDIIEMTGVTFKTDTDGYYSGFVLFSGTTEERNKLKKIINDERQSIKSAWFMISKPWLASAIKELGKEYFENVNKCIMHPMIADFLSSEMIPCAALLSKSGCCMFVWQTDCTQASCDVIVNVTNNKLECEHGSSRVLCKAAGNEVVNECKKQMEQKGELSLGEVFVGKPGDLQCCSIFHVVFPLWTGGIKSELEDLKMATTNILKEADKAQYTSIIITVIGCEKDGFTIKDGTRAIVNAVWQYMNKHENSSIREIYFSDSKMERINGFIEAVETFIPKQSVFKHGRPLPEFVEASAVSNFYKSMSKTRISKPRERKELAFIPENIQQVQNDIGSVDDGVIGTSQHKDTFSSGLPFNINISDTLSLHVESGSLESQNVDVIVNTTPHFPEMGSAVARAIIKAGGNGIVEECRRKGNAEFKQGKVVRTSGGNLTCKHIYHVHTDMMWDRHSGAQRVYDTVTVCLKEADRYKCQSISFPTIGTGASNYPADKVADSIMRAVCDFSKGHESSTISHIHVVIYFADIAVIKIFEQQVPLLLEPTGLVDHLRPGKKVVKGRQPRPKLKYTNPGYHTVADDVLLIKLIANGNLNKLIRDFEREIDSEYGKKTVAYGKELKDLSESEEILIKSLGKGHYMTLDIDKRKKEINMTGLKKELDPIEADVREMLTLKIPGMRNKHLMGEQIASTVEWHFENNGTTSPVSAPNNYEIHTNYLLGKDFEYKNSLDGKIYKVLVNSLEEHPVDTPGAKRKLYQKVKISTEGPRIPEIWTIAQSGQETNRVVIPPSDPEFQEVKTAFIKGKCQHSKIVNIIRIEDKYKWLQYQAKKKQVEKQNPKNVQNERHLWHGTTEDTVEKIIHGGYDRNFCGKNATAYGEGVYFAVNSAYSNTYSAPDSNNIKRMFYNKVLTGVYCKGRSGMGYLPLKTTKDGFNVLYDSAVNDTGTPTIYVIFHDTQAYPEYIVEYM